MSQKDSDRVYCAGCHFAVTSATSMFRDGAMVFFCQPCFREWQDGLL